MSLNKTKYLIKDYKVIVVCRTYNHSKYIVDALNGFAMQQTDFPFDCIVIDDASTDGEPEVIKDWLQIECDMEHAECYDLEQANIIIVPHNTNTNCTFTVMFIKKSYKATTLWTSSLELEWTGHFDYIAFCEGDDYWTDSRKLQIQSDFLDVYPEIDLCTHSYEERYAITGTLIKKVRRRLKDCIIPIEDVIIGGGDFFATASTICRSSIIMEDIPMFRQYMFYDYTFFIHAALRGGVLYLDRDMAIYRRFVPQSWCNQLEMNKTAQKSFYQKCIEMLNLFNDEYHYSFNNQVKAAILIHSVVSTNSWKENIHSTLKYRKYFKYLPLYQKIRIILKCCCPFISSDMFSFQKNRKEKR